MPPKAGLDQLENQKEVDNIYFGACRTDIRRR